MLDPNQVALPGGMASASTLAGLQTRLAPAAVAPGFTNVKGVNRPRCQLISAVHATQALMRGRVIFGAMSVTSWAALTVRIRRGGVPERQCCNRGLSIRCLPENTEELDLMD